MRAASLIGAVALLAFGGAARAAVVDAQANGFELRQTAQVKVPPQELWNSLIDPGSWWSPSHTYSQNAGNLSLAVRVGGCWCEGLPGGGGVEHLRVVFVSAPKTLRLEGGLGPLQATGGDGHLTFTLAPKDGGTALTVSYVFGGYVKGGFEALAGAVDGVLAEQVGRLVSVAETGTAN